MGEKDVFMLSGEHGLSISQHLFCFNLSEIHNTKKKDKNRGDKNAKKHYQLRCAIHFFNGLCLYPYDDYNHYYHGLGWTGYAPFPLEAHRPPPNGHGGGHPGEQHPDHTHLGGSHSGGGGIHPSWGGIHPGGGAGIHPSGGGHRQPR
ncbi:hypothetical protein [Acinetobacter johnsonii]|uniref:hypothetical protein n=1 Tax=Acinetobacter johnsonii TaxID=40214 RepID=UPI001D181FE9|nr:hypothetical protein [Acinetobacter johnsonii]